MDKTSLGDRMKRYEASGESYLVPRTPLMLRLDGKGFSKFTKGLKKPMDENLRKCMEYASYQLVKQIEGCRFAYTQSDEITLILVDYASRESQPWFNYRASKVLTIAASICTSAFIKAALCYLPDHLVKKGFPLFDARAWNLPKEEVCNAVIWRQQDATRNAIQSLGHAHFSHKELHNKNCGEIQDMLFLQKGINFNDEPTYYKRGLSLYRINCEVDTPEGVVIRKRIVSDEDMPILTKDRNYVENWLEPEPNYEVATTGNAYLMEDIEITSFNVEDVPE
jgi:tRNA(His) guanylyltransferase